MSAHQTFGALVVDPPWDYEGFASAHTNQRAAQPIRVKALPYESMSLEAIKALPVAGLVADHARLFLWTTNRYIADSFDVLTAWGFNYRQTLVWRKTGNPSPFGGSVAPNHAEFLLVAAKGSPPVVSRIKSSVIDAPAAAPGKSAPGGARSHSAKPEIFNDIVEQTTVGPYLELFARRRRLGWSAWGDQVDSDVELVA